MQVINSQHSVHCFNNDTLPCAKSLSCSGQEMCFIALHSDFYRPGLTNICESGGPNLNFDRHIIGSQETFESKNGS